MTTTTTPPAAAADGSRIPPGTAVLMTMLVPGLAHLRLGDARRGAFAFVSCVGLFFAGYAILGTRIWHFELVSPSNSWWGMIFEIVPLQLLPESLNLGPTIVAGFLEPPSSPAADRLTRLPRDFEHVGALLTAISGVLAGLWAADAHWRARGKPLAPEGTGAVPAVAAAATWLVPGLGHAMVGQRSKGVVTGAAVLVLFALGLVLSAGQGVDRGLLGPWYIGDIFCGLPAIFASAVLAPMRLTEVPGLFDLGVVLCCAAGLLNIILIVDSYTIADRGPAPLPGDEGSAA